MTSNQKGNYSLRIIGGKWRSRKVSFPNNREIRPTPDRVRETVFNWLQEYFPDAYCLELYAGSGILSLEALSRGASEVILVEKNRSTIEHLAVEFEKLTVPRDQYQLVAGTALDYLSRDIRSNFDIIFLDPPFGSDDLGLVLGQIHQQNLLCPDGLVYVESATQLQADSLGTPWTIHRQKKAGAVHYCLLTHDS